MYPDSCLLQLFLQLFKSKQNKIQWIGGKEEEKVARFLSWVAFKLVEVCELLRKCISVTEHVVPCLLCLERSLRIQFGLSQG